MKALLASTLLWSHYCIVDCIIAVSQFQVERACSNGHENNRFFSVKEFHIPNNAKVTAIFFWHLHERSRERDRWTMGRKTRQFLSNVFITPTADQTWQEDSRVNFTNSICSEHHAAQLITTEGRAFWSYSEMKKCKKFNIHVIGKYLQIY